MNGINILFPSRQMKLAEGLKLRGGIPVLFPNAHLPTEHMGLGLKQHGFARLVEWQAGTITGSSAELILSDTVETRHAYPFAFNIVYTVTLEEYGLGLTLSVTNRGDTPLPIAPGLHPYFSLPESGIRACATDLGINLQTYQSGDVIRLPYLPSVVLTTPELMILLKASSNFTTWTVWGQSEYGYVCFEPWQEAHKHKLFVEPQKTATFWLKIRAENR